MTLAYVNLSNAERYALTRRLKGNPVKSRNCPAAVTGNERSLRRTGFIEAGKREQVETSSKADARKSEDLPRRHGNVSIEKRLRGRGGHACFRV